MQLAPDATTNARKQTSRHGYGTANSLGIVAPHTVHPSRSTSSSPSSSPSSSERHFADLLCCNGRVQEVIIVLPGLESSPCEAVQSSTSKQASKQASKTASVTTCQRGSSDETRGPNINIATAFACPVCAVVCACLCCLLWTRWRCGFRVALVRNVVLCCAHMPPAS